MYHSIDIFGTGFIAHESGIVITNQHVYNFVNSSKRVKEKNKDHDIKVIYYNEDKNSVDTILIDIIGSFSIGNYTPTDPFFDRKKPDIAVACLKLKGLPSAEIDFTSVKIYEGNSIATSGFPMGNIALAPSGYIQQVSPILQSGIISAVLPFNTDLPVSFMLNIMIQEGASGSPVFECSSGKVIGIIFSRLYQPQNLLKGINYKIPTNFSYAVPMIFLKDGFDQIVKTHLEKNESKLITIEEHLKKSYTIDGKTGKQI